MGSVIHRAFQHRSGRVISLSRLVLALVFFLAVWIDPAQPARDERVGYIILVAYFLASAAVIAVSWNDWWADFRLARPAHAIDIGIFLASVYFTEGYTSTFTSPFFTFFAFLLLSATLRWGWRGTVISAVTTTSLYFLLGIAMMQVQPTLDIYRFGRRVTYLVLLSLVLIWFGVNQRQGAQRRRPRELEVTPDAAEPPMEAALRYAAAQTGATRGVFAWWSHEEPWVNVIDYRGGEARTQRFGPQELGTIVERSLESRPFLFDRKRGRALQCSRQGGEEPKSLPQPLADGFGERFDLPSGLAIPIRASTYSGEIFLIGIPGMCCDDLSAGVSIGEEVAQALDRYAMRAISEESAVNRTRVAIARDLHDSVAQVLAGALFRMQALRSWIKAGEDPDAEIVAIKQALRNEQQHVRTLIAKLRLGGASTRATDLVESLATIVADVSVQWGKDISFHAEPGPLEVPAWLAHELHQLVREGAANAVRHGGAASVTITISWSEHEICLIITDDGDGFPAEQGNVRPWSMHERVKSLGGTLSLLATNRGAKLDIKVPRGKGP